MTEPQPKYALDLSNDKVAVWTHDQDLSWTLVSKIKCDDPDFSKKLKRIKTEHAPDKIKKFSVLVRIPRSEIFISEIPFKPEDTADRAHTIKTFLSEKTPYNVDELVSDCEHDNEKDCLHIAAITKTTLSEAKAFLSLHGFETVFYTTKLENDTFPREPRFYEQSLPTPTPDVDADQPPYAENKNTDLPPPPPKDIYFNTPAIEEQDTTKKDATAGVLLKTKISKYQYPIYISLISFVGVFIYYGYIIFAPPPQTPSTISHSDIATPRIVTGQITPSQKPIQDTISVTAIGDTDAHSAVQSSIVPPTLAKPDLPVPVAIGAPISKDTRLTKKPPSSDQTVTGIVAVASEDSTNKTDQDPSDSEKKPVSNSPEDIEHTLQQNLIPTKNGTPGPEGITLFAGQPDFLPPRREQLKISKDPLKDIHPKMRTDAFEELHQRTTAHETQEKTINLEQPNDDQSEVLAESEITPAADEKEEKTKTDILALADPELKDTLPKNRPVSLTEHVEDEEKTSLINQADPALAAVKPKRRPNSITTHASQDTQTTDDTNSQITESAVLKSGIPRRRPQNFTAQIAKVKAHIETRETTQQNTADDATVQTAALTPAEARGTSQKSNPSALNVQKEATERTGFKKRRMSLIGVYGTPSNRRALVRMPTGRYVKVQPGKQVGGWKVVAIGESSVRITKGSRNEVLRMPK